MLDGEPFQQFGTVLVEPPGQLGPAYAGEDRRRRAVAGFGEVVDVILVQLVAAGREGLSAAGVEDLGRDPGEQGHFEHAFEAGDVDLLEELRACDRALGRTVGVESQFRESFQAVRSNGWSSKNPTRGPSAGRSRRAPAAWS